MDQPIPHTTTTTVSGETKAGATTINVASGAGLTNGDKVGIVLYDGRIWKTTVTVAANVITPATPTPKLIRTSAIVSKYTTPVSPDLDQAINLTRVLVKPVTDAAPAAIATLEFDLYELGLLPATKPMPIV